MKKTYKSLTSFADHLNKEYGKPGTLKKDYEQGFETFNYFYTDDLIEQ